MQQIKLHIKKRGPLGYNWVKFSLMDKVVIDDYSPIKTEAQLCYYIYKTLGPGRYQILAWQKKVKGFWLYFLGDITENGFIRDRGINKELEKLKVEFNKSKSFDDKQDIEEEMQFEKEIAQEEKKMKRHGPYGIITSRVGVMHSFQEY